MIAEQTKILTRHPEGKQGTNIDLDKYEAMKKAILKCTPRNDRGVSFKELPERVVPHLPKKVYGPEVSVRWYTVTVKLDLEARGLIKRLPGSPQRIRRP